MSHNAFIDEKYDENAISLIPFCELKSDFLKYNQWPVFTPCAFCPSLSGACCVSCASSYSDSLIGAISCSDMNSLCNRRRCRVMIKDLNQEFAILFPRTYFSLNLPCYTCGSKEECECKRAHLENVDCVSCGNSLTQEDKAVTCANQYCPLTDSSSARFKQDFIPLVCDRCVARKFTKKPFTCLGKCRTTFNLSTDCYFPFSGCTTEFKGNSKCRKCKEMITPTNYMPCHNLRCPNPTCRECHGTVPEMMWCSAECLIASKTNGKVPYADRFLVPSQNKLVTSKAGKTRSGTVRSLLQDNDDEMIGNVVGACDYCHQASSNEASFAVYLDRHCLHWFHHSTKYRPTGKVCASCFCSVTRCAECTVKLIDVKRCTIYCRMRDEYEQLVKPINVLRLRVVQLEFFDLVLLAVYLQHQGFLQRSDRDVLQMIANAINTLVLILNLDAKQDWNVLHLGLSSFFEECVPLIRGVTSRLPKSPSTTAPNLAALHITNHITSLYTRFADKEDEGVLSRVAGLVLDSETKCSRVTANCKKAEVKGKLSIQEFRRALGAEYTSTKPDTLVEKSPFARNRKRLRLAFESSSSTIV